MEALTTIIRESERLRVLAKRTGDGFLAYLLETVLHEARAVLIGEGGEPEALETPANVTMIDPSRRE